MATAVSYVAQLLSDPCPPTRTPEQCPHVVSLLSESFNAHVRCGSAMALGIGCAGTGNKVCFVLCAGFGGSWIFFRKGGEIGLPID